MKNIIYIQFKMGGLDTMKSIKAQKIFIILIILMVLVSCSKDVNNTMGEDKDIQYKEAKLDVLEEFKDIEFFSVSNNDKLAVSGLKGEDNYIIITDNNNIIKEIKENSKSIESPFTYDNKGNLIFLDQIIKRENEEITGFLRRLRIYDSEYNLKNKNITNTIEVGKEELKNEMIVEIKVDSNGNIYALKLDNSIEVFNNKLEVIKTLDSDEYKDFDLDENDNLIVLNKKGDNIILEKLDGKKYSSMWKKEYKSSKRPYYISYNKKNKTLYGVNGGWILEYDTKEDTVNRITNLGELSTFDYIYNFSVNDNEEIYALTYGDKKSRFFKYIKDNRKKAKDEDTEKKELVIDMYRDYFNFMLKAKKSFEKKHPDIKITINTHPDIEFSQYREKLNTQILVGDAPDILYYDSVFPINDYIDKNVLFNMDERIKNDGEFNLNNYNTEIIDSTRLKGGAYVMPIDYSFDTLIVNKKLLDEKGININKEWTWEDIYKLKNKLNTDEDNKYYIFPKFENDWFIKTNIINQDLEYFLDYKNNKVRFNTDEFINKLKLIKNYYSEDCMDPNMSYEYIFDNHREADCSNIAMIPAQFNSYKYINHFGAYYGDNFNMISLPRGKYTNDRFFSSGLVSITKNSKYKDEAWEFVKFLLSKEVQLIDKGVFSVNKEVEKIQIKQMFTWQKENKGYLLSKGRYLAEKTDVDKVKKEINKLNKVFIYDEFLKIIDEEVSLYINGEKTAEETAKILQNKGELYLQE
ncbi:MAG: extracellular solute-binding protein [Firmicutes bacterium]|nr:extracellular solute-binding protein [Bacillota bacterium]